MLIPLRWLEANLESEKRSTEIGDRNCLVCITLLGAVDDASRAGATLRRREIAELRRHSIGSQLQLEVQGARSLPVSSSTPPRFSLAQEGCYRSALEALNRASIPYAVAGAFALHEYSGIWRDTKDLDIVLEAVHVPAALRELQRLDFTTFIQDPVWLAKAYKGEFFVDLITALGNAVLRVDESWIDRATPVTVLGIPCRVLAVEEVIASKLFVTRRERFDGADIAHLIHARAGKVDWNRVESLLDGHWELVLWALVFFAYVYPANTGMVDSLVWQRLLRRFEAELQMPRDGKPFRGTLIDPNMFAIDVKEWGEQDLFGEYCSRASLLKEHEDLNPGERELER